jgi:hypothetical protein
VAEGEGRLGGLNARSLAEEPIVRLILDDTAVRARITEEIAGQTWAWGRLFHSPG